MELLYELAKQNLKNRKVLVALMPTKRDSPLFKLYTILYSGIDLNDYETMIQIYGRRCDSTFSMLKERMKSILVRALITEVTQQEINEGRFHKLLNNERTFIGYRLLYFKGSGKLATKLLEVEIKNAIKFQFTEEILRQLKILVQHYATNEYNKYKLQNYIYLQDKYLRILYYETKAMRYFVDLQRVQMQSLATISKEIKFKASQYVNELESIKDIESTVFNYFKFKVIAAYYEFESKYESLLELCNEAEIEFKDEPIRIRGNIAHITRVKSFALIQLGKYDECILLGKKEMKNHIPGTNIWYLLGYYTLKALLYKNKIRDAVNFISLMLKHPHYKRLAEGLKELFFVNLGYIHLITGSGLTLDSMKLKDQLPEFRLAKFLNTAHVFNKDKRGINVSILLLEIAFLLQRKKYDAIIDRLESLEQYSYRYLRKDDTFRSNCMIKLVIQMAKCDFHPVRTRRLTQDLHKKLSDVKLKGSGSNIEIEVIPFEVLWEIMLKAL